MGYSQIQYRSVPAVIAQGRVNNFTEKRLARLLLCKAEVWCVMCAARIRYLNTHSVPKINVL